LKAFATHLSQKNGGGSGGTAVDVVHVENPNPFYLT